MNEKVERVLYFDCYSGISGDMTLGALLECGVKLSDLQAMLKKLKLSGYTLETKKVKRGGLAGTRALVRIEEGIPVERNFGDIISIINNSELPLPVKNNSTAIFRCLAEAEAAVHDTAIEKVHFHEVGALDSIIDIVGTCAAIFLLGVDRIYSSPLPAGRGAVTSAHGKLPLPAPATLQLIAKRGVPVEGRDWGYELVTPTGAAIVTALAEKFGSIPAFNVETVGYGAGSIDPGYANYLRVLAGKLHLTMSGLEEEVKLIEANIDDLNPEIYGYLMEKLMAAGALDVYYTPVQMKKNRPGVQISIIALPKNVDILQNLVFRETTTLGLRISTARKVMRQREEKKVETEWGEVRIKFSPEPDGEEYPLQFSPEYEDCRFIAEKSGLPLKEVYRLAEYLFRKKYLSG
ncbi:MAG: nickel pincer cofactor biosynthesis protein LarC [Bacillota bacterium]